MTTIDNLNIKLKDVIGIVLFSSVMIFSYSSLSSKLEIVVSKINDFEDNNKLKRNDDKEQIKDDMLWRKSIENRQNSTDLNNRLLDQRLTVLENK